MQQMNLARKWRSRHFDELIGQPLAVRLVKNSLYRNLIFPVYLLAGTRGCGKTSLARIFAAALNCSALEEFQKNPQRQLPCLECTSCKAMQAMNHPDFIEIDAASHTGVDNVRQIIDAASFVPVLGTKKIYLIDEAHMLSKAAFNALLKILEEPPQSVVFMLATTDPHKILETVTSRCFQLFFEPISEADVISHLAELCKKEGIEAEPDALRMIAHETGGSMRDALNLIERLRIAYSIINKQAVTELLGTIDDERLAELFTTAVEGSAEKMLDACVRLELHSYNSFIVWKKLVEMIRISLWIKQGVMPAQITTVHEQLKEIVAGCSYERLIALFELCYSYELSFAKTAVPSSMLEMMLLKMCTIGSLQSKDNSTHPAPMKIQRNEPTQTTRISSGATSIQTNSQPETRTAHSVSTVKESHEGNGSNAEATVMQPAHTQSGPLEKSEKAHDGEPKEVTTWMLCLKEIETLSDPLVVSIFKQATNEEFDAEKKLLALTFPKDLAFFKDWLENSKKTWKPLIEKHYAKDILFTPLFTAVSTKEKPVKMEIIPPTKQITQTPLKTQPAAQKSSPKAFVRTAPKVAEESAGKSFVPNETSDPVSSLAIKLFPGTLHAITIEENQ